jgi:hypothetical protein
MANAVQGEEITLGTTSAVNINITDIPDEGRRLAFFIKVKTATTGVKVGIDSIAANAHAWTATETVSPYYGYNGHLVVQGAATDVIIVTATVDK